MFGRRNLDDVSPAEALRLQASGAVLVDVREPAEWRAGHAPRAVHVPLGDLMRESDRFREVEVLAVCRSGHRSAMAVQALAAAGVRARNVAGGMKSWAARGLPVLRDDGTPGTVG